MKAKQRIAVLAIGLALGAGALASSFDHESFAQPQAAPACELKEVRGLRGGRITLYSLELRQQAILAPAALRSVRQAQVCSDNLAYVRIETDQGPRMVRRYQVDLGSNITPPPCPCQVAQATEARNASSSGLGSPLCNREVQCVWGK